MPSDAIAITHPSGRLTYGELDDLIDQLVVILGEESLHSRDRVAIVAENSLLFVAAFFAAIRAGACAVPINARLSPSELQELLVVSDARAVLFITVGSQSAQSHAASAGARPIAVAGVQLAWRVPDQERDLPPAEVAAIVYTSGTTGKPKGVMLSHRSLLFNAQRAAAMRQMKPDDVLLLALPCTHIMALASCLLSVLSVGASLQLLDRFTPQAMLAALADGATIMPAVPVMYDQMLAHMAQSRTALEAPRLRQIGSGGAPLDPGWKAKVEQAFGLPLHNSYGMTEAGPGIASTMLGPLRHDTSVGYAFPGCELRLAEPGADGGGELEVRGPNIMTGYFRDPEATASAITADGFLRTGDLARIEADGAVHVVGRAKEMIIRSGFNVYPAEVETVLLACPGVGQAAVVGRHVNGNEEIVAFVTAGTDVDAARIGDWCRMHLTAYKRPQHIVVVDMLPTTAAGKIRKQELISLHADRLAPPTEPAVQSR